METMTRKLNLEDIQKKLNQLKRDRRLAESNDYRQVPKSEDLENDVFDSNNVYDHEM